MNATLRYIVDVIATLCGFDAPDALSLPGMGFVSLAALVLVYACYRAVLLTLWPGESDAGHAKHRVLRDEESGDAH